MTSAPKSDMLTAAAGPAIKLARSTTFNPEKMLSVVICCLRGRHGRSATRRVLLNSVSVKLQRPFCEKGRRPFGFVARPGAQAEQRCLERKSLRQVRLQPAVHRLERELHGDRGVGENLLQDRFGSDEQLAGGDHLVDESDPVGFPRLDHAAGEDGLQAWPLTDQSRQTVRAAAAWDQPEGDFGLTE